MTPSATLIWSSLLFQGQTRLHLTALRERFASQQRVRSACNVARTDRTRAGFTEQLIGTSLVCLIRITLLVRVYESLRTMKAFKFVPVQRTHSALASLLLILHRFLSSFRRVSEIFLCYEAVVRFGDQEGISVFQAFASSNCQLNDAPAKNADVSSASKKIAMIFSAKQLETPSLVSMVTEWSRINPVGIMHLCMVAILEWLQWERL